jgi:hypothetical protein
VIGGRPVFPRVVTEVLLDRGQSEPIAYSWTFAEEADAFRIAAHADVVMPSAIRCSQNGD